MCAGGATYLGCRSGPTPHGSAGHCPGEDIIVASPGVASCPGYMPVPPGCSILQYLGGGSWAAGALLDTTKAAPGPTGMVQEPGTGVQSGAHN